MEITTTYNLDDIFYELTPSDIIIWVVHNIYASAVSHKIVYDFKNVANGKLLTIEEKDIENRLTAKNMYRNLDEVKEILTTRIDEYIKAIENLRKEFMKGKLKRVLHGEPREADTSNKTIKEKLEPSDQDLLIEKMKEKLNELESREFAEKMKNWYDSKNGNELASVKKLYDEMSNWKKSMKSEYNDYRSIDPYDDKIKNELF